jgi:hypothetical protein
MSLNPPHPGIWLIFDECNWLSLEKKACGFITRLRRPGTISIENFWNAWKSARTWFPN